MMRGTSLRRMLAAIAMVQMTRIDAPLSINIPVVRLAFASVPVFNVGICLSSTLGFALRRPFHPCASVWTVVTVHIANDGRHVLSRVVRSRARSLRRGLEP